MPAINKPRSFRSTMSSAMNSVLNKPPTAKESRTVASTASTPTSTPPSTPPRSASAAMRTGKGAMLHAPRGAFSPTGSDEGSSTNAMSLSTGENRSDAAFHDAMTTNASVPTAASSTNTSISSADAEIQRHNMNANDPASMHAQVASGISLPPRTSVKEELERIRELEGKRMVLRNQRFSLEQRLYEFCGTQHSDADDDHKVSNVEPDPEKFVVDMEWKDPSTDAIYSYSGPLNMLNEPHGRDGIVTFADGQMYTGAVRCGKRDGQGVNRWPDGQVYTGEWKANSRNGRGTHVWPDGRKTTGHWTDGHLNGKVYFMWPNGAKFDGTCKMGKKHGRGVHTWSDGRMYSGNFEDGKENGFGTLTSPDGVKYRGQFKNGQKHGYGIQLWRTRTYDGEWEDGKPHGQGRVVWSNGATYTGRFLEGKYHGLGVYVWPSGKKFVGRWQHGVKHGHGLYTWPSGKKYDGEYRDGVKHGYGRMQWADGQIYCGAWMKNMRHGRGIQTTPDGAIIYCGQWNSDLPLDDGGKHVPSEQELKLIAEIRNGIPSHVEMHLPVSAQTIIANRPNGASNVSSDHPQQFNADNGVSPRKHDATDEEIRQRNAHIAAVNSSCSDQLGIALADIHIADAPPAARLVV